MFSPPPTPHGSVLKKFKTAAQLHNSAFPSIYAQEGFGPKYGIFLERPNETRNTHTIKKKGETLCSPKFALRHS